MPMVALIFIIVVFIICVGGCWLIFTVIGSFLFPSENNPNKVNNKPPIIHNHYYHNENHLHITKEDLTDISRNQSQIR